MSETPLQPGQDPTKQLATAAAMAARAMLAGTGEAARQPVSPETVAVEVCRDLYGQSEKFDALMIFGSSNPPEEENASTDEGHVTANDLDLRMCWDNLEGVDQEQVKREFIEEMKKRGVAVPIDLLFMERSELLGKGIRDLTEKGPVEDRFLEGMDPHDQQAAVGGEDYMGLISLYILATLRPLYIKDESMKELLSPEAALRALTLLPEAGVGLMHYYRAYFQYEQLNSDPTSENFRERAAKCLSRVTLGNVVAQLRVEELAVLKDQLVAKINEADAYHSTDQKMIEALLENENTSSLLDPETIELLKLAGIIRSGNPGRVPIPADFTERTEAMIIVRSAQQGRHRRTSASESADVLNSRVLELLLAPPFGQEMVFSPGQNLIAQDLPGQPIDPDEHRLMFYIPFTNPQTRQRNGDLTITVQDRGGNTQTYHRDPGREVGSGALLGDLPRSATVAPEDQDVFVYAVDTAKLTALFRDPQVREQMRRTGQGTTNSHLAEAAMRHLLREFNTYTKQTYPYTELGEANAAQERFGSNPFQQYDLGPRFRKVLQLYADQQPAVSGPSLTTVTEISAGDTPLFTPENYNDSLYVLTEGTVDIVLTNGETVSLGPNELFGEASVFGRMPSGAATLRPGSRALKVHADWFNWTSQSRRPLEGVTVPPELNNILPFDLWPHMLATMSSRLRRRLLTHS